MSDRSKHQVLRLQGQPLRGDILVQRKDAGRLAFEPRDDHATHMHHAHRVAHAKLQRAVGLVLIAALGARGGVNLGKLLAGHVRRLEVIDRLDLRVRVDDAAVGVLEHHAHGRVAEDGVHHLPLAFEGVDQLELADQDRGLAGKDSGEAARLRRTCGHARHQQADQPALDLDREAESILRRAQEVEQRPHAARPGGRHERAQQLRGLVDRDLRSRLAVRRAADEVTVLQEPQLALR